MKVFLVVTGVILTFLTGAISNVTRANPQLAMVPDSRANMEILNTRLVKSEKFDYEHAVTIALPATYRVLKEKHYPVLWVLDDPLLTRTAIATVDLLVSGNMIPEIIVIGVGSPAELGLAGVGRRIMEYSPPGQGFPAPGLNAEAFNKVAPMPAYPHRAEDFLHFIGVELRESLAKEFRFANDHILHGHSLGGLFAGYTLFSKPSLFNRMIISSPAMANVDDSVFKLEEEFYKKNKTLPVQLFVAAGGNEGNVWFLNAGGILSGTARFVERMNLRDYEKLNIQSQFYTGENHYTVVPRALSDGLRHFFQSEAKKIGSTWPAKP